MPEYTITLSPETEEEAKRVIYSIYECGQRNGIYSPAGALGTILFALNYKVKE